MDPENIAFIFSGLPTLLNAWKLGIVVLDLETFSEQCMFSILRLFPSVAAVKTFESLVMIKFY